MNPTPTIEIKRKKTFLDNVPEPKKIISVLLIALVFGVIIKFWPALIVGLLGDYSQKSPQDVSPIIFALFGVIAILILLLAGVWSCRGIWWPFMRASWTNSIILMGFSKNKIISFIVPKEINWNHIRIDDESTIDPDPESRYTAPNKVPVLPFIPDHAKTIDPRGIVLNADKDLSIDINTLDNIGTLNLIKGMKKMTNPLGSMINSGIVWLLIAGGVLFFVMWPYFSAQMDQSGKVSTYQNSLLECNQRLVASGQQPVGIQPPTTTTLPKNIAQPSAGIVNNPNNIK